VSAKFDVIILGGGPAGAAAAISLLQKGYKVAIIEKSDFTGVKIGETVQPQIVSILAGIKIDAAIFNKHLPSYSNLSSWGSVSLQENNFFFNPFGNGWHLNRLQFDTQLVQHAVKAGAKIFLNSEVKSVKQDNAGNWEFIFISNDIHKTIECCFAADASGRNSFLVKKMGGKRKNADHLIALAAIAPTNSKCNQTNFTMVESVKTGWWYSADIPGDKTVTAFMTDADLFKTENCEPAAFFSKSISKTRYTKSRYPVLRTHNIGIHAANSYLMSCTHGKNWIAIGDAAMAFDPLSSQGIYKAVKSGINAAELINDYFNGDADGLAVYSNTINAAFEKYLQQRKIYYADEKRWPGSLFWKRRHNDD
jgi:flavin-dependent dehydrogenase